MKISTVVEALVAAGATPEVILGAVRSIELQIEQADEAGREKARARWRKWKAGTKTNVGKRLQTTANANQQLTGGDARVEDNLLTSEIEPQKEQKERNALTREFDDFWTDYPNKVGKPKAKAAFVAARKRADLAAILKGLERYIACKPADRAWLNPATFLNQDRWDDQPANVVPMARGSPENRVNDLINSMIFGMDTADANATTQTEGYPAAPLRISRQLSG